MEKNSGRGVMLHIGIDGGTKTGFAIWDSRLKKFTELKTVDFWTAYYMVQHYVPEEVRVYIEDPSQNKPVFKRPGMRDYEYAKKCQNVGMVKRESTLLIEGLERLGYKVTKVRPTKGSLTKMNKDRFRTLTKHQGTSSEHSRDAAMMVFQR